MENIKMRFFIFLVFIAVGCSSEGHSKKGRIDALDGEILQVSEDLKKSELEAMKGDLNSQEAFRDNYSKFASQLSQAEKEEVKAEKLKKKLKVLQQERSELLKGK
jgi:hypothetical protein